MKIRRKANACLNCGGSLNSVYNYCPNCGQENNNNNVSFKTLIADFFNNYIALDSKFGKSFKPFFCSPGFLTNKYIEGARASYANPIRLYLIVSIFYFFIVSIVGKDIASDKENIVNIKQDIPAIEGVTNKEYQQLNIVLSENTIDQVVSDLNDSSDIHDLGKSLSKNVTPKEKEKLESKLDSLSLIKLGLIDSPLRDSLIDNSFVVEQIPSTQNDSLNRSDERKFILTRIDWDVITRNKYDRKITNEQLYDSIKIPEDATAFERLMVKQSVRVVRADNEQIIQYILKNLPLMMLLLIPIFALILKLMYVRNNKELYIKHLIHSLHIHSFAYIIYGISLIVIHYLISAEWLQISLYLMSFIGVSSYAFISFMNVYHQKWFKTLVKFNLVGLVYFFLISFFFVSELFLSMLLF